MKRLILTLTLFACAGFAQAVLPGPDDAAAQIRSLEQTVKANPADLAAREQLLRLYRGAIYDPAAGLDETEARNRMVEQVREIVRLDPGRRTAGAASRLGSTWRDPVYPRIRAIWLEAAARHGDRTDVQVAAAAALAPAIDHQEILRLTAGSADPQARTLRAEALGYALVYGDPVQAAEAQTQISLLSDPNALHTVSAVLMQAVAAMQNDPTRKTEDVQRYQAIVRELREKAGPTVTAVAPAPPPRITVGGNVQEHMLLRRVDPVYPAAAAEARISGFVKFTAVIGRDGKIQNLQLLSGHPLFVQAATDAVRQWEYKPTLLNGRPVEVVTQITVPMELPK